MANRKQSDVDFCCGDLLSSPHKYDLIICADVFEHVDDSISFLRNLRHRATYFLFNIPLEMNMLAMLRGYKFIQSSLETVGHIHFYSATSALLLLEYTGYNTIISDYARNRTSNFLAYPSLNKALAYAPQLLIQSLSPYLASILMGDSLVVLALS